MCLLFCLCERRVPNLKKIQVIPTARSSELCDGCNLVYDSEYVNPGGTNIVPDIL